MHYLNNIYATYVSKRNSDGGGRNLLYPSLILGNSNLPVSCFHLFNNFESLNRTNHQKLRLGNKGLVTTWKLNHTDYSYDR